MKLRNGSSAWALLLVLSACDAPQAGKAPTLHEVMAGSIDPVADMIWQTSAKAYGVDGNAKAGLLTDKDWQAIQQAGRSLHDGAAVILNNPGIAATRPGVKILDEGTVPEAVAAAQVAVYLDRDRPGLTQQARDLSSIALAIEAAAKARDVGKTVRLSEDLDDVCEACHKRFWYPDQPKWGTP